MLSICQICLSTDKTLQGLKEPLSNWHDELCDFGIEDYALYCSECAYMLKKFHNFKEKCLRANKLLKKWKKQNAKVRSQLSELKKEMPPSSLSISLTKNHKVFSYKSHGTENQILNLFTHLTYGSNSNSGFLIDTLQPDQMSNSDAFATEINNSVSNVDTLMTSDASNINENFCKDISHQNENKRECVNKNEQNRYVNKSEQDTQVNNICELKTILIEPYNENDVLKESEVKIEDDVLTTETIVVDELDELQVKNGDDSDNFNSDYNTMDHSDGEFDVDTLLNENLDSDSSDDEILLKKCKKSNNIKTKRKAKHIKGDSEDISLKESKKKVKNKKDTDSSDETKSRVKQIKGSSKKLNVESIKYKLLCKFGSNELKDEDGNIIDKDCILDSLDKLHKYTLNKVKRHCLGSKQFTSEAIQVLSQIQKRYGNQFSSVFNMVHFTTTEEALEEFNKRQQHVTYLNSAHHCTLCYRGFKHRKLLDYHINEYHNPERAHVCPICQMRFKSSPSLCKHNALHRVVYKCKLCPLVTNYRTVMESHYNQHNGVKYNCEYCKAVLNSKGSLHAHLNCMHPSRYVCTFCARTFVSEIGLSQHKIRKHPGSVLEARNPKIKHQKNEELREGPGSRRCDSCAVTFISEAIYEKHMLRSHAEKTATNYACTYKKRQIAVRKQPPKFICRVCSKVEHSVGRMTWHFKTDHPDENTDTLSMCAHAYKHLCHVCGKGYTSITDFNEHKHLHTGARPYACDKCPKAFHRKTNLRMHLERHYPPTRECQHCGKKFLSAANLNNHIRMHIGIRRYTCELCSKSFLHRSSLNAHVRGVHLRIRRNRKTKELAE